MLGGVHIVEYGLLTDIFNFIVNYVLLNVTPGLTHIRAHQTYGETRRTCIQQVY